jgi:outer membrane receptor protein involved in Fe transport
MIGIIGRSAIKLALISSSVGVIALSAAPARAQQTARSFDIPAQSLSSALAEFSKQSDTLIMTSREQTAGKRSRALKGNMPVNEALRRLLSGSGLRVVPNPEGGFRVERNAGNRPTARTEPISPLGGDEQSESEEIVVTGTNIRGVNPTAPVTVITREEIERSGYTSVPRLMESLPQNFGGGANGTSEDGRVGSGADRFTNVEGASGVNLRGLGAGATLTLINGRRVAPSAYGATVDVSSIPIAAIERVEVLPDGSSAIYGTEAIAGVVNFILRKDYEGAETRVRVGSAAGGDAQEFGIDQTLGFQWSGGGLIGSVSHEERNALVASDRRVTRDAPDPTTLISPSRRTSVLLNGHQKVSDEVSLFFGGFYSRSKSSFSSAFYPPTNTSDTRTERFDLNLGTAVNLGGSWELSLDGTYSRQVTDYDDTTVSEFAFDFTNRVSIGTADLKIDGELFALPAGPVRLALGGSARWEKFSQTGTNRSVRRDVYAAFAEVYVPVLRDSLLAKRFDLSAAARLDDYSDFGSTDNYKLGAIWTPVEGLDLRASFSTAFRAPFPLERFYSLQPAYLDIFGLANPVGPGEVPAFLLSGSQELQPETAKSYSFGGTFRPAFAPKLKITVNRFVIDYRDRISFPPFALDVLTKPDVYGSLITQFAGADEAIAFRDAIVASGGIFADYVGTGAGSVRYLYDLRQQNAAEVKIRGFDLSIDHQSSLLGGQLDTSLDLTYLDKYQTTLSRGSTPLSLVDTFSNVVDLRGRLSVGWSKGPISIFSAFNYTDNYNDPTPVLPVAIDSWSTFDASLRYAFPQTEGWAKGLVFTLAATNLFNSAPPRTQLVGPTSIGYDPANASPLGRFVSLSLAKRW